MNDFKIQEHQQAENLLHDETVEVDLASAGSRIGAALLNGVFNLLAYIPLIVAIVQAGGYNTRAQGLEKLSTDDTGLMGWLMGGFLLMLVYGIVQIFYMSRDGQSLGKKVLGIRVLKTDGQNPGFLGTVLIREIGYGLVLFLISAGIGMLGVLMGGENLGDILVNLVQFGASGACVVMLFQMKNDRRTLQDMMANTVVVKLPKK